MAPPICWVKGVGLNYPNNNTSTPQTRGGSRILLVNIMTAGGAVIYNYGWQL